MRTFAERLKFAIDKKGISQAEAARKAGISQQSMNYIITNNLSSSKLAPQIAAGLSISAEWLIYGSGRLEEAMVYELPVLATPYEVLKYINEDIDLNSLDFTVINTDLGERAFAYLISKKRMAICSSLNNINSSKYLKFTATTVTIADKGSELSFPIFEWRKRYCDF